MTIPVAPGQDAPAPRRRRGVRIGLVLVLVGLVVAVPSGILAAARVSAVVREPSSPIPGAVVRSLGTGEYRIYQRTGTRRGGGGVTFTTNSFATLTPDEVRITAPDGRVVPTWRAGGFETLNRGGEIYTAALSFDAPVEGTYTLLFTSAPGQVVVSRGVGQAFRRALPGILGAVVGGLMVLTGLITTIVSALRGRTQDPAVAWKPLTAMPAPPGFYPDPAGGPFRRYWDGTAWTSLTSP